MLIDDFISSMCLGGSGGYGVLALGEEEKNGEATVAGACLNQGSCLKTFLASFAQTLGPSALWLLPTHSCAGASASLVWRSEKVVQEPHLPTHRCPQSPRKKNYRFLIMPEYFRIFISKFLLSFLN